MKAIVNGRILLPDAEVRNKALLYDETIIGIVDTAEAQREADEITAVWSGIDGAEGYEVQVSDDPGFSGNVYTREFFFLAMFEGMVDRLAPGVQYYVRVRAIGFNDAYMSPWSNVKSCVWE